MGDISVHSIVSINKEIVTAEMDGETVMMSVETGKYYNLGKMGSVIWGMLGEPSAVDSIIENLLEKYQVGREQCEVEVLSFLKQTHKEGLLKLR